MVRRIKLKLVDQRRGETANVHDECKTQKFHGHQDVMGQLFFVSACPCSQRHLTGKLREARACMVTGGNA